MLPEQNAKCHVIFCDKTPLNSGSTTAISGPPFLARSYVRRRNRNSRSGGCRKVRWSLEGRGKSGSVRIIYTTQLSCGAVVALLIYGKGATEPIPAHILYKIAKDMNHATHLRNS